MLGGISKYDFIEGYQKIDKLTIELNKERVRSLQIQELLENEKRKLLKIPHFQFLPTLSFSVTTPHTENENRNPRSLSFAQLRCVASFDIDGKKNRLTIIIGRLDDYPDWITNKTQPLVIARTKVFTYLTKNFPNFYSVEDKEKITSDDFLKSFQELDKINRRIWIYEEMINPHQKMIVRAQQEISEIEVRLHLPKLYISEVHPDISKIQNPKSTITHPHLRCMATYKIGDITKRLNIYLGRIEDFPNGVNDLKAIDIAREKSFNHLQKNFPTIFFK
jgi:hypothetical protein